ncbi:FecR family protein [Sphingomonas psychrotolerans]|uniref:Iron dicitrate transport regulator FecR n=1 Tax=Sphingomonas psychrotolerans TaxID=1327635 RepID=A0A2K8MIJ4_9SPHN|nr:FecR domain-containing protein [Sphingomonas psychrotolerans]ATY31569.1 iron dicitrate transport regulator FecR [Sphingomonas psychrotolerans]
MSRVEAPETQHDRRQQARAEAALWVARGNASDPTISPGLDAWLGNDPLRADALGRTLGVWDELGQVLPDWKRDGPVVAPAAPVARRRVAAMASLACALLICVLSLSWYLSPTVYRTGVGERRVLALADGTRVTLNTGSELQVFRQGSERRSTLVSGEAMFDVAHDPEHPFVVEAAGRYVRALGTSFIVRNDAQRLDVTLLTGSVDVGSIANAATRPVRLTPGERYRGTGTSAPSLDRPKLDMVTAWRHGELVLDQTPLPEAVAEMNRYSSRPIVLQGPELARLRLSGVFQTSDSVSFATTVGAIYGVRVVDGPRDLRIVANGPQPR